MPEIIIIAALSSNRVIGNGDRIPWHISEDFKRFKSLTLGFPVIMGRKTWESLPKRPLPGRKNIIVTRNPNYPVTGAIICGDLEAALKICAQEQKVFIIGGASLYQEALPLAHSMELTHLSDSFEGDVLFPVIDPGIWKVDEESPIHLDGKYGAYRYVRYVRRD